MMTPQVIQEIGDLLVREDAAYSFVPHGIQQAPNVDAISSIPSALLASTLGEHEQYVESN